MSCLAHEGKINGKGKLFDLCQCGQNVEIQQLKVIGIDIYHAQRATSYESDHILHR
jgi:hypothetical protein